jgi:hypothetical protein
VKQGYTYGLHELLGREEGSAQTVSAKTISDSAQKINPRLICLISDNCQVFSQKKLFTPDFCGFRGRAGRGHSARKEGVEAMPQAS